jgi:preprotein translocase subunit SecD
MTRNWWTKFLFLIVITAVGALYVYPTVENINLQTTKFPFKHKINLGLDLQGGLYMVLGVDFNKVFHDVVERQGASLKERAHDKDISITDVKMRSEGLSPDDPHVVLSYPAAKHDELYALIKKEYWTLRFADDKPGTFELALSSDFRTDVRERTISQSIEVIRNRIDEFGVSEPAITSQGTDRIVVELPGVKEVDRAKDLIGRTAKLEFKMVDDKSMTMGQIQGLVSDIEKTNNLTYKEGKDQKFSEYVQKINDFAKAKIPADDMISFERRQVPGSPETVRVPYLLHAHSEITGDDLQDANVTLNQERGNPEVAFSLNPHGASVFGKVTKESVGHAMAIVLDNIVYSAPVINSAIPDGRGVITLGRSNSDQTMKEAKDLSIVLRAGALPAQLDFLEQRVVGPSLGADSIKKGALASVIGTVAVFIFIAVYYQISGLIAVVSLLLNVLFVLAILVGLDATLTLPGIAGIALTVGIAVDSNVVIYERIREELALGKNVHGAVEAGFQKAFRTIMDANVTNALAAIVLLTYGTGPIKGFAVTLLIGIVTTLFTAVFVCKVIFDAYLQSVENRRGTTLSI